MTIANYTAAQLQELMPQFIYDQGQLIYWYSYVYRFAVINNYYTLITTTHRAIEKENLSNEETAEYYYTVVSNSLNAIQNMYPIPDNS